MNQRPNERTAAAAPTSPSAWSWVAKTVFVGFLAAVGTWAFTTTEELLSEWGAPSEKMTTSEDQAFHCPDAAVHLLVDDDGTNWLFVGSKSWTVAFDDLTQSWMRTSADGSVVGIIEVAETRAGIELRYADGDMARAWYLVPCR